MKSTMLLQPTELQPRSDRPDSTVLCGEVELTDGKPLAEVFADYCDAYVDELPELERQLFYNGLLDVSARPDWRPPVVPTWDPTG